jgi:hypothetical protein
VVKETLKEQIRILKDTHENHERRTGESLKTLSLRLDNFQELLKS